MKQMNNSHDYISELKKLYPECIHDSGNIKNIDKYHKDGYPTTYGEMDYDAIEKLNNLFNSDKTINYYIDFGSGRGKLPLFMANKIKIKSIGIELVEERHNDAVQLKETLSKNFPEITDKVELVSGDMFNYLDSINKETFVNPVLIWVSNLCFGEELTNKLFNKLIEKMPSGTIISSSLIPKQIPTNLEPINIEDGDNTINVPMSWSKNSFIYVYKIK